MTTWGGLLADIRSDLKDTGATPRWGDDILYLFAKDAINAYSLDFPLLSIRQEIMAANGTFDLPSNYLDAISVETAPGEYLKPLHPSIGLKIGRSQKATSFYISTGKLHLDKKPQDGMTVLLSYYGKYDLPTSKDDKDFELDIPQEDEELVRLFMKAKIAEQIRLQQSNLDRFKPSSGARDDNPMLPEHNELMKEYRERVAERTGGIVNMYSTHRMRR